MAEYSLTFGKCLDRWMTRHDVSVAELAKKTGLQSGTTISRLRHDQCTTKRCVSFFEQMLANEDIPMSPQEEAEFRSALDVNRMQSGTQDTEEAFRDIFFPNVCARAGTLLQQLRPLVENAEEIHILTFQRSSSFLFQDLLSLLQAYGDRIHIHCCLHSAENDAMARLVADAMPLLFNAHCCITVLPAHTSSPGDLSILRCKMEEGWRELLLLAQPSKRIRTRALPDSGLYDFFYQVAVDAVELSHVYDLRDFRSCAQHLEALYRLEKDAESCLLQPDLPFFYIPVDVLHNAFQMEQAAPEAIMEMRRISYLRTANAQTKTRPTHLLLSCKGMKRFMETGELKQKLRLFRPLTEEERKLTLCEFLKFAEENELIDLHISGEERLFERQNISAHMGHGVALMPSNMEGNVQCEAFVRDTEFSRDFRRYFCKTLIPGYGMGKEESIRFLKSLL